MRFLEKHELHSFYVMYAYAIVDLISFRLNLKSTENAIRRLRRVKPKTAVYRKHASMENF